MLTALAINAIAVLFAFLAGRGSKGFMTVSQLLLSFVYGIRYDYGNDYWNYYDVYLKCSDGFDPSIIEPGWGIINVLCQPIGFMGMVFLITQFEYYAIYKHIRLYIPKEYWWLAVFIFTFTFNFQLLGCSMMRQFLAMVILLYSVKYVANRNVIIFLIVLGIAFSIHKTAIVFLPVMLLGFYRPVVRSCHFIIIAVVVFICLLVVSAKYIEYFQLATLIFNDEKFNTYLMGDEGSYSFTIIFDILWLTLLMLTCPSSKTRNIICIISLISYILLPFTFVVVILLRLMLFFSFYFIFSIPNMFSSIKTKMLRYGFLFIYVFLLIKRSIASMTGETYGDFYDTFQTIFSAPSWI